VSTQRRKRSLAVPDENHRHLASKLTRWFRRNARDLPWRRADVRGGYAALVSEAMLQQTQVSRVVESFRAFMARFPDVDALAVADEQDVLAAWTGLGYYRRARHLHRAAKAIVADHESTVPSDPGSLGALPGVGRYTAGAIASIVFGRRAAIVDGNVARVLLRLHGRPLSIDDRDTNRWVWAESQRFVDAASDPGAFNEGLMELGATVCTPRTARCDACPWNESCVARRDGIVDSIPKSRRAGKRMVIHHHSLLLRRGDLIRLEQRDDEGLWASMWQVPTIESSRRLGVADLQAAIAATGIALVPDAPVDRFVHLTTHREVRFHVHQATTRRRRGIWLTVDAALERPLSAPMRRIIQMA